MNKKIEKPDIFEEEISAYSKDFIQQELILLEEVPFPADSDYLGKLCEEIDDFNVDLKEYGIFNTAEMSRKSEISSFYSLQIELQANKRRSKKDISAEYLMGILEEMEKKKSFYHIVKHIKKDGSTRICFAPNKQLRKIQKAINKNILQYIYPENNVFGFSGGSVVDAIYPHSGNRIMLSIDVKNAFPSIKASEIFAFFIEGRVERQIGPWLYVIKHGRFSWRVAKILTTLTTYNGILPQGALTSPRIFDLIFARIDRKLNKLAENTNGTYTRYADNIFFSFKEGDEFPEKITRAIIRAISGKRGSLKLSCHKLKITTLDQPRRMLGLNLIDGEIHNTREFKRKLRMAIFHVNKVLDLGLDHKTPWNKVKGMMSFAIPETLPEKFFNDFFALEKRINSLGG